jgi:hypothetical protein
MGANAQTSVPVFTSGQVLTAQQQTEINTGIPVFATSVERDAAFNGTGLKTLAEGQFAFLEDTDATQYYDGSTWEAVGGASGLTFITGASFTTAATVSFASGVFTSTYQNYIVLLNLTASSTDQAFAWRVNNAGSPRTTADYIGATNQTTSGASLTSTGSNSTTSFSVGIARNTFPDQAYTINVYDPANASTKTSFSYIGFGNTSGNLVAMNGGCFYNVAEANDGLTFFVTGTISGSYKVYGLANS